MQQLGDDRTRERVDDLGLGRVERGQLRLKAFELTGTDRFGPVAQLLTSGATSRAELTAT